MRDCYFSGVKNTTQPLFRDAFPGLMIVAAEVNQFPRYIHLPYSRVKDHQKKCISQRGSMIDADRSAKMEFQQC